MTTPHKTATPVNLDAALCYAARGWHVFPCRESDGKPYTDRDGKEQTPRAKQPYTPHGLDDATTDPAQIRQWWGRWPGAAIGLNCGRSGLLAIDLDTKHGHNGPATWAALGLSEAGALLSQTPSGGRHVVYTANGAQLGNTAGRLGDGIDTRGDGGYIILPPSTTTDGAYIALNDWGAAPAPLPGALAVLLAKPPERATATTTTPATATGAAPEGADLEARWARAALEGEADKVARAQAGTRNDTLNAAAFALGQLVGGGYLRESEVESALFEAARACGLVNDDGESATEKTIKSGLAGGKATPREKPHLTTPAAAIGAQSTRPTSPTATPPATATPPTQTPGAPLPKDNLHTDMGNAARFALQQGGRARFVKEWGWVLWDGQRWLKDDAGAVMEIAKATARAIFNEARDYEDQARQAIGEIEKAAAAGEDTTLAEKRRDDAQRAAKEATAWAVKSQFKARLEAMLALAESDPRITARPDAFDTDPWLLNCTNGVLDLRTGDLLPPDPARLITRLCPVAYDAHATCPQWEAFLARIFADDSDMVGFIQRAAGYSLTGNTREQCMFFAHGSGANGKSVFTGALLGLLGDYALKTPMKTLTGKDIESDGTASPDLARLAGARLVIASEIEAGRRLNESLVKDLTGGDRIAARFLRKDYFEFDPRFKLWIYGNHKPVIRGTDDGIWRRVNLIPFDVTIPEAEQDKDLSEKLKAEYPGILAWLAGGCIAWLAGGLQTPGKVKVQTEAYRAEMDALGRFLEERTMTGKAYWVMFADLRAAYEAWCTANGENPLGGRRFADELTRRGFEAGKGTDNKALRRGLALAIEGQS